MTHIAKPTVANIVNPAKLDFVRANDTCIQCHSQGQPLHNPIEGKYVDWPAGFEQGKQLKDSWELEEHKLGETTFTHFADGTGHKNRMQGNDFVQSLMYRRGVTCSSCHDASWAAERPHSTTAYTHKLDLELDTALHVFNWLPEGRWLRGVELETSLDYLATGLPRKGDVFPDGSRYLDDASGWSISFVIVLPVAPF